MSKLSQENLKNFFQKQLLHWNKASNKRQMPWKGEKDPYKIWLSEIILQQTRVEQGLQYYERFLLAFPTLQSLATAKDEQVYKQWEGLGYYSRCTHLIHTARVICNQKDAKFPDTYEELKKLKGVGPYTAAAIASFAFDQPHAVVDGNVYRVLSRFFGIKKPVDSTTGKKYFSALANELIDQKQPATYNQAIMDFGAQVCKPSPDCNVCVLRKNCFAFLHDKTSQLPVKQKKLAVRHRYFDYLVIMNNNKVAITQRNLKDIWKHLYEFPMIETAKFSEIDSVIQNKSKGLLKKRSVKLKADPFYFKQQLTHQVIHARFIQFSVSDLLLNDQEWIWVKPTSLKEYSFPRIIRHFIHSAF